MHFALPMADPKRQYLYLREEIDQTTSHLLASGTYIGGEEVACLEAELADYLGLPQGGVVGCGNGTDALEIAYQAVGLEAGDEVIVPSMSYVAPAEAALRLGLCPVWVDVAGEGDQRFNISPSEVHLSALISPRTRALVGVNMYGYPVDTESIRSFCRQHSLIFIEDNAQGLGGCDIQGSPQGTLGDIATTSFFPTKPLGCMGDGGAVLTANKDWAERARMIANHGQQAKYSYQIVGKNSRLDALQAAILRVKLRHLDWLVSNARRIASLYIEALSAYEHLCLPTTALIERSSGYLFTLCLPPHIDRASLIAYLRAQGIALQLYYPDPLHTAPLYRSCGIQRAPLTHTEALASRHLSLPTFPLMTGAEAEHVIHSFTQYLSGYE